MNSTSVRIAVTLFVLLVPGLPAVSARAQTEEPRQEVGEEKPSGSTSPSYAMDKEETVPPDVPEEYVPWYKRQSLLLDTIGTAPGKYHPMTFGAHLITANPFVVAFPQAVKKGSHNDVPAKVFDCYDVGVNLKLVDVLSELGVDYVKVMMRYPDAKYGPGYADNYRKIFKRIRQRSLHILIRHDVVGPEWKHVDPESPTAARDELEKRKAFIYDIVAEYKPEYLELPPGPTGFGNLFKMLPEIRASLNEVSAQTRIIIQTGPGRDKRQLEVFKMAVDSPHVDIAAIHITDLGFGLRHLRNVRRMAGYARSKGKTVWSTDVWLTDGGFAFHGPGLTPPGCEAWGFEDLIQWIRDGKYGRVLKKLDVPWRERLDARYMEAVVDFAQRLGFESVSPFHTQYFIEYDVSFNSPLGTDIARWRRSLERGRRTTVFYKYRDVIATVRARTQ